jgi:protein-tyrosine phosphatase
MVKLYFVCMGNYYRSRLAEELALYYAAKYGVEIQASSGGLSKNPHAKHLGAIAKETLAYLEEKNIQPQGATKTPQHCDYEAIEQADIVVLTDDDEQRHLFVEEFPEFVDKLIGWQARDIQYDPGLHTLQIIDLETEKLIKRLLA